jgi:hypothetical protein
VAKKNMAERYASQRSSKVTRRRALPRLSDADVIDGDDTTRGMSGAEGLYDVHEVHATRSRMGGAGTTFTTGMAETAPATTASARPRAGAIPRRAPGSARGAGVAGGAIALVNYGYVRRDLRRIAITAVAMLILLIVLNVVLQAVFH